MIDPDRTGTAGDRLPMSIPQPLVPSPYSSLIAVFTIARIEGGIMEAEMP